MEAQKCQGKLGEQIISIEFISGERIRGKPRCMWRGFPLCGEIDLKMTIDKYGKLYYCITCIVQ